MGDTDQLFSDGPAYERLMGRWSRVVGRAFRDWLDAPRNCRCLDIGCGNGAFTEELIARCTPAAVIAIDPSENQLAFARTRPGVEVADFRVGDAQSLLFADHSFDFAVMALVISFLSDPDKSDRRNGACGTTWRAGRFLHVGHSGRRDPSPPDLSRNGIDGCEFRTSTQSNCLTARSNAGHVGKGRT